MNHIKNLTRRPIGSNVLEWTMTDVDRANLAFRSDGGSIRTTFYQGLVLSLTHLNPPSFGCRWLGEIFRPLDDKRLVALKFPRLRQAKEYLARRATELTEEVAALDNVNRVISTDLRLSSNRQKALREARGFPY